jgi:hypothetical protein
LKEPAVVREVRSLSVVNPVAIRVEGVVRESVTALGADEAAVIVIVSKYCLISIVEHKSRYYHWCACHICIIFEKWIRVNNADEAAIVSEHEVSFMSHNYCAPATFAWCYMSFFFVEIRFKVFGWDLKYLASCLLVALSVRNAKADEPEAERRDARVAHILEENVQRVLVSDVAGLEHREAGLIRGRWRMKVCEGTIVFVVISQKIKHHSNVLRFNAYLVQHVRAHGKAWHSMTKHCTAVKPQQGMALHCG